MKEDKSQDGYWRKEMYEDYSDDETFADFPMSDMCQSSINHWRRKRRTWRDENTR